MEGRRFLGIGESNDLGSIYLRLQEEGHEVKVFVADPACRGVLSGLISQTSDWRAELEWLRNGSQPGIIIFESAALGAEQDRLRAAGFLVMGGSAFGDRLESDREFAQNQLSQLGLRIAATRTFISFEDGIAYARSAGHRLVFKLNGSSFASGRNFVGEASDGSDMVAMLELQRRALADEAEISFVLQRRVEGIECGVGAYFDGQRFLSPACIDWEHKRFFPGDLGELTGEMGTLVSYRRSEPLFSATLGKMAPALAAAGHRGYLNLNTIINKEGIFPLEFTCRFGYPGSAILGSLQLSSWGSLFTAVASGQGDGQFMTQEGFAVGVVLTIPPFPIKAADAKMAIGLSFHFEPPLNEAENKSVYLGEVDLQRKAGKHRLVTTGPSGNVAVVTGVGATAEEARAAAYALVRRARVPNLRYRNDIAVRFIEYQGRELKQLGWI